MMTNAYTTDEVRDWIITCLPYSRFIDLIHPSNGFEEKVYSHFYQTLLDERVSLDANEYANGQMISLRTFQRQAKLKGCHFNTMRDKFRRLVATLALQETELRMQYISEMLRFSSRNSFTASFKRWYRKSPRAFRKDYT